MQQDQANTPRPPVDEPTPEPTPELNIMVGGPKSPNKKIWLLAGGALALLVLAAVTFWFLGKSDSPKSSQNTTNDTQQTEEEAEVDSNLPTLDPNKNYGDKYANGLLPVGDDKYSTSGAEKGKIYMCNANFVPDSQAGAQTRGPWFTNNNTRWDINKKISIQGKVNWDQNVSNKVDGSKRVITSNGLPDHHTGVFPVASSDPAKTYDANPNTIKSQSLTYNLTASPSALSQPKCMGGEVGIMLTGVALFNGFDAGGRDAGAWEVQDSCDGHPQSSGIYHYHSLSRCIKDVSIKTVIGFALDGFPITGPKVGDKNILTTSDLDECHGIVSEITFDGKKVTTYHYVMTQDFPYSASCFRAEAIESPGQHSSGQTGNTQQGSQSGSQPPPPGGSGGQGGTPPPPY